MKKIFDSIGGSIASAYTSVKYGKDVISPSNLPATFYELKASTLSPKQPLNFASLKGKLVLVVNIASMCGYTAGNNKFLSNLANEYKSREDFVILAFPCAQFAGQEHADETKVCSAHMEGLKDCKDCLGQSLVLMEKVDVNGDSAHEVFKWLRTNSELNKDGKVAPIPWNYGKFLLAKDGKVVKFFKSGAYDEVKAAVAAELGKKSSETNGLKDEWDEVTEKYSYCMHGFSGPELVRLSKLTKQRLQEAKLAPKLPRHIQERRDILDSVAALPSTPRGVRVDLSSFIERRKAQHDAVIASFESARDDAFHSVRSDLSQTLATVAAALAKAQDELSALLVAFADVADVLTLPAYFAAVVGKVDSVVSSVDESTREKALNLKSTLFTNLATLAEALTNAANWEEGQVDEYIQRLTEEVNCELEGLHADIDRSVESTKREVAAFKAAALVRYAEGEACWRDNTRLKLLATSLDKLRTYDLNSPCITDFKRAVNAYLARGERDRLAMFQAFVCADVQTWTSVAAANLSSEASALTSARASQLIQLKSRGQDVKRDQESGMSSVVDELKAALTGIRVSDVDEGIGEIMGHIDGLRRKAVAFIDETLAFCETREHAMVNEALDVCSFLSTVCQQIADDAAEATALAETFNSRVREATQECKRLEAEDEESLLKLKETLLDCVHISPDLESSFKAVVEQLDAIEARFSANIASLIEMRNKEPSEYKDLKVQQLERALAHLAVVDEKWIGSKAKVQEKLENFHSKGKTEVFLASLEVEIRSFQQQQRTRLEKQLTAHAFRRGQCELEWLKPKEASILRHKTAFSRHVFGVKKFFYEQKDAFFSALDAAVEAEKTFNFQAKEATGKIAACQSIAEIMACQRSFREALEKFEVTKNSAAVSMALLASSVELVKCNEDFRKLVEVNVEYSARERAFYNTQIDELVKQITGELADWESRLAEFRTLPIPEAPKKAFENAFAAKQEEISARLGLGRKYGAPRQVAQEKVSSLMVPLATAKSNATTLAREYMTAVLGSYPEQRSFWWRAVDRKFVACTLSHPLVKSQLLEQELLTATFLFSRTVVVLLLTLGLLKDEKKNFPTLNFFEKPSILVDLTDAVAAGINPNDKVDVKLEQIKTDSLKAFEKTKRVPEFMTAFFERAQNTLNKFKRQVATEMATLIAEFRSTVILRVLEVSFSNIQSTASEELRDFCERLEAEMNAKTDDLQTTRARHEKQMSPFLANPANRSILKELLEAEETRSYEHARFLERMEKKLIEYMNSFESAYVSKVREYADTFLLVLDLTPLVPHIQGIPEKLQPRPSLEELIQKSDEGKTLDLTGNVLELIDCKNLANRFASSEPPALMKIRVSEAHAKLVSARDQAFAAVEQSFLASKAACLARLAEEKKLCQYNSQVWTMMLDDLQGNSHN